MADPTRHILLSGIVGSTAYGMARPGSDIDRLGVYAAPTVAFHGLNPPTGKAATHARHDPDVVIHEAAKFVGLCLAGNPTVSELLWLPADLYETRTPLGGQLVDLRHRLLSAPRVRDAYYGYANQQFQRLVNKHRFPDVPVDRIRKHARHLLRLVEQGTRLWTTGELHVRVNDPDRYFTFGDRVLADPDVARPVMARAELTFTTVRTPLPDEPDRAAAEAWLLDVRHHHYDREPARV